jgi:hypothetical protein
VGSGSRPVVPAVPRPRRPVDRLRFKVAHLDARDSQGVTSRVALPLRTPRGACRIVFSTGGSPNQSYFIPRTEASPCLRLR